VEPRLAQDGVAEGGDVSLAQARRHVLGVEDQVIPESEDKSKERVSEGSKGRASNGSWAKNLVQVFLSYFVRIFSFFSEIVNQSLKIIKNGVNVIIRIT